MGAAGSPAPILGGARTGTNREETCEKADEQSQ